MGAIADTIVKNTELAGDYKIQILTATPASASDTIVLTAAANKISEIVYAHAHLTAGLDANLAFVQTSWSSLTITIKMLKQDGSTAADDWTSAALEVLVIGK